LFAKEKEIFLEIDSTYPWYDEITSDLITKPLYLIKIGISNKEYLVMSKESTEWHPAVYVNQMKNIHQKISRLSQQTNYRVVYEDASMIIYREFKKPAKDKDVKAVKDFEEKIDQLKNDHEKLAQIIQEKCCRYFGAYYKGHVCRNCPKKTSTQNDKEESIIKPRVM
jgi:hypothetical protein